MTSRSAGAPPRQPPRFIAVEGPIGAGKTTLARRLAASFGHELVLELADENPFLESFYRERARKLNREIDSHNVGVPIDTMQQVKVPVDANLAAFWAALGLTAP